MNHIRIIDGFAYVTGPDDSEECPDCDSLPAAALTCQEAIRTALGLIKVAFQLKTDGDWKRELEAIGLVINPALKDGVSAPEIQ